LGRRYGCPKCFVEPDILSAGRRKPRERSDGDDAAQTTWHFALAMIVGMLPMSFSRIFRLSRSACVVLAADALAPVVEGWFVILEVSGVGGRAIF